MNRNQSREMKCHLKTMLLGLFTAITLSGCASIVHSPVPRDSPFPRSAGANPCQLHADGKPMRLEVDKSCVALVPASAWLSRSNLEVTGGERYSIAIPPEQIWYDSDRVNVPPAGEPGNWIMNLFEGWKRHNELWFTLMAATSNCVADIEKLCTYSKRDTLQTFKVELDKDEATNEGNKVITIAQDSRVAELVFYPNDASGPGLLKTFFYNNNHGQIWLVVKRLPNLK